jgi:hypothetical protein
MQENLLLSKPENSNEFHSDLISLFEKLDKNIEIGNNE